MTCMLTARLKGVMRHYEQKNHQEILNSGEGIINVASCLQSIYSLLSVPNC